MRTRSQTRNHNRRQQQQTLPIVVEPCNLQEPIPRQTIVAMADRTMKELLRAPTEGYGEAIVLPKINADHFEIKTNLLQLVQANPFHGLENENPHAHINSFKRITSTLRFRNVPNDVIKLMMFPYSLEGAAKTWFVVPPTPVNGWAEEQLCYFVVELMHGIIRIYLVMIFQTVANPTSTSEPFTSEFTLEEIDAFLYDKSISLESDHDDCDPEEDIYVLEQLLNDDPFHFLRMD
ncbi:hypothetical protein Tco_0570732 [Tanacetum coccineum]